MMLQKRGAAVLAAVALVVGMGSTASAIESFQERFEWGDMSKPTTIQGRVIVLDPYDEAVWINTAVFGGNAESGLYWQKVHPGKTLKFYADKSAWQELKKMGRTHAGPAAAKEVPGRGSDNLTLLGLATAVKREWIEEMFPQHITAIVEHLFDRAHKRVAAVRLVRFRDLVIHHEHQRDVDPTASGRCLAETFRKGWFELPLFNHEVKQFIGRVNLAACVLPELEIPPLDDAAITRCLARAFVGLTLSKEAQATPLRDVFRAHLQKEQLSWIDELTPLTLAWPDGRKLKLLYSEFVPLAPGAGEGQGKGVELQIKLHECFQLREHPRICEGKLPVKLWLCAPDGKRLEATDNWPAFRTTSYPKLKPALQKKYPSIVWV